MSTPVPNPMLALIDNYFSISWRIPIFPALCGLNYTGNRRKDTFKYICVEHVSNFEFYGCWEALIHDWSNFELNGCWKALKCGCWQALVYGLSSFEF